MGGALQRLPPTRAHRRRVPADERTAPALSAALSCSPARRLGRATSVPNGRPRQTRCPSRPFRGRRGATFQNPTSDAHGRAPAEIGTGQPSPQARAPLPGRGSAAPTSALARAGPVSGRGGLGSPARRTDVEVGVVANQQRNDVDAVVERGPVHRRAADLVPVTGVFVTACPETLLPTLWTVEAGRTTQFFSSSIIPLLLTPVLLPLPRKSESLFPI